MQHLGSHSQLTSSLVDFRVTYSAPLPPLLMRQAVRQRTNTSTNQLRYHVLPTLNHLGLLPPLKLGSPPNTLTPTTTLAHSNSWLSLIGQQACNRTWTVHSTCHTCHNVTPQCSPHRHIIWALIMEGLPSTTCQQEALQRCTKPKPIVTWGVRHARWPLPCYTLRTATILEVGGRHVGATTCGASDGGKLCYSLRP